MYIYVKFLALLGVPHICDINRLRVNYFWKILQRNYGSIGNAGYYMVKLADLILVGEIINIVKRNAKILCGLQKKWFQVLVIRLLNEWTLCRKKISVNSKRYCLST
jgi:hypothetical protein